MTTHQHRPARDAGLVIPAGSGAGVLCMHGSLIGLINASDRLWVITGSPAATTRPASSDNQDSRVWKERHEFSA